MPKFYYYFFVQSRDDELANSWDTKMQEWVVIINIITALSLISVIATSHVRPCYRRDRSSVSADEDVVAIAKVVELSLSESQPFNRFVQS